MKWEKPRAEFAKLELQREYIRQTKYKEKKWKDFGAHRNVIYSQVRRSLVFLRREVGSQKNTDIVSQSSCHTAAMALETWCVRTAITKYHKLSDLNHRNVLSHTCRGWKSEFKVLVPSGGQ